MKKKKITIEDLIRKEGREPGGMVNLASIWIRYATPSAAFFDWKGVYGSQK
jgi:hypothetical protein